MRMESAAEEKRDSSVNRDDFSPRPLIAALHSNHRVTPTKTSLGSNVTLKAQTVRKSSPIWAILRTGMQLLKRMCPKCRYLLRGNSVGQNLISLWERGQNFIFPVHEPPGVTPPYSVSKLGAWNQGTSRRCWASKLVPSVPCMNSGGTRFLVFNAKDKKKTKPKKKCFSLRESLRSCARCSDRRSHAQLQKFCRDVELLAAPQRALFRPERFLPLPWSPPLSLSLSLFLPLPLSLSSPLLGRSLWLQEVDQIEGLAAFTPEAFIGAGGRDCEDDEAREKENRSVCAELGWKSVPYS